MKSEERVKKNEIGTIRIRERLPQVQLDQRLFLRNPQFSGVFWGSCRMFQE